MAVVTQTDRPKSVCNSCIIEHLGGIFVLSLCFFSFSVGEWYNVIGLGQIRIRYVICFTKFQFSTIFHLAKAVDEGSIPEIGDGLIFFYQILELYTGLDS